MPALCGFLELKPASWTSWDILEANIELLQQCFGDFQCHCASALLYLGSNREYVAGNLEYFLEKNKNLFKQSCWLLGGVRNYSQTLHLLCSLPRGIISHKVSSPVREM